MRSNHVRRFVISVAAMATATALLAGCSDDSSESDESSSDASAVDENDSNSQSEPGSTLELGEPGVVAYESGEEKTELEVTPVSIEQGDIADLSRFNLTDEQKDSTPFYVTTRYENVGSTSLEYPSLDIKMNGVDDTGQRHARTILMGALDTCESGNAPENWGQGATLESCSVYLIPAGAELVELQYAGNFEDEPLTWEK